MQGTILVIDGVATNRIMLKRQLAAAYFDVCLVQDLNAARVAMAVNRPDLVLTAMQLPDGNANLLKAEMRRDLDLWDVPVIALSPSDCPKTRLHGLAAGIDDILPLPVDDVILQARIRSLLRACNRKHELQLQRNAHQDIVLPYSDPADFSDLHEAHIGFVMASQHAGSSFVNPWSHDLKHLLPARMTDHSLDDVSDLMSASAPDVIVLELTAHSHPLALRLIADLRARAPTRHCAVIAIPNGVPSEVIADALDRGAHDILHAGFSAQELALRVTALLRQKRREDRLRATVRKSLRAAVEDPMTGLHNRRYAIPFLERTIAHSKISGQPFAVLIADLDHFKQINDQYGHPVGDKILVETAQRLQSLCRKNDLLARIGGEEFMMVLPDMSPVDTAQVAATYCEAINNHRFEIEGQDQAITMTISIGAIIGGGDREIPDTDTLIASADRALYTAKNNGRNRVTLGTTDPVAA
ncbi:diguanylate cyclase [Epibacterium ulvae]|uniref:diguanylate cyclase n=1 Tax=Epibacterium ulvae TaxID=1156985 RepID=UPI00248FC943|nr:diguanylate cyclase [Epibacterium ulvae]